MAVMATEAGNINEANPLPVSLQDATLNLAEGSSIDANPVISASFTDRSVTIGSANVAQTLMALNASRKYLLIQNNDPNNLADIWINFGTTAVKDTPSILLPPGASFERDSGVVPPDAVSVICASVGKKICAKEA